jgi:hypothetical protein
MSGDEFCYFCMYLHQVKQFSTSVWRRWNRQWRFFLCLESDITILKGHNNIILAGLGWAWLASLFLKLSNLAFCSWLWDRTSLDQCLDIWLLHAVASLAPTIYIIGGFCRKWVEFASVLFIFSQIYIPFHSNVQDYFSSWEKILFHTIWEECVFCFFQMNFPWEIDGVIVCWRGCYTLQGDLYASMHIGTCTLFIRNC